MKLRPIENKNAPITPSTLPSNSPHDYVFTKGETVTSIEMLGF